MDIPEHIKSLLAQSTRNSQIKSGSIFICCPFHNEKSPSCKVTIHDSKFLPGSYFCFGCGVSGGWNSLAEKLGLKFRINSKELAATIKATVHEGKVVSIEENSVEDFIRKQQYDSLTEWPEGESWRGVDYKFLKAIEAFMIMEFDEQKIFLPVTVNNVVIGGIRASVDRKKYLTTNGEWVKTNGLFPFDVTKKMMLQQKWKTKFVVLVEGPRDVARLVSAGIPALAILGSKQWSVLKTNLLMSIIPDDFEILTIFDSDSAGVQATNYIKNNLKDLFIIHQVKLPENSIENGVTVKTDVFNLSSLKFLKLISVIEKRYA